MILMTVSQPAMCRLAFRHQARQPVVQGAAEAVTAVAAVAEEIAVAAAVVEIGEAADRDRVAAAAAIWVAASSADKSLNRTIMKKQLQGCFFASGYHLDLQRPEIGRKQLLN